MEAPYSYISDILAEIQVPENGILSRTLHNDESSKIVAFGFAAGQELSAHTAPVPAILYVASGEALLRLGADAKSAGPGTVVHMAPRLEHGILAKTAAVILLVLLKKG